MSLTKVSVKIDEDVRDWCNPTTFHDSASKPYRSYERLSSDTMKALAHWSAANPNKRIYHHETRHHKVDLDKKGAFWAKRTTYLDIWYQ